MFQLLDGQRIAGFADVGDINFSAIEFVFGLYDIDRDKRLPLFERIIKIDEAVGDWRRKNSK